ncbi:hypothetical protein ACFVMC_03740 [Nocardia sp. NPDC127579]|uniref:hypothetical protein n=1 Tax=Nocardia sp. NPDC127579 TaxID=3345402 RepID=UPI00362899D2
MEATDDLGISYNNGGGFRRRSADGQQSVGTLMLQPALAIDAKPVTLRFVFSSKTTQFTCELPVDLT